MSKEILIESSGFSVGLSDFESSKSLVESVDGNKPFLIKRVPCSILNKNTLNGRFYSTDVVKASLIKAVEAMKAKRLICQGDDHPVKTSYVKPTHTSHVVVNAWVEPLKNKRGETNDVLFNDWLIIPTVEGDNLKALITSGVSFGTSIRGLGEVVGGKVSDYEFLGTDVVGNPASGTFSEMYDGSKMVVESCETDEAVKSLTEEANVYSSEETANVEGEWAENLANNEGGDVNLSSVAEKVEVEIENSPGTTVEIKTEKEITNSTIDKSSSEGNTMDAVNNVAASENALENGTKVEVNMGDGKVATGDVISTVPASDGEPEKAFVKIDSIVNTEGSAKNDGAALNAALDNANIAMRDLENLKIENAALNNTVKDKESEINNLGESVKKLSKLLEAALLKAAEVRKEFGDRNFEQYEDAVNDWAEKETKRAVANNAKLLHEAMLHARTLHRDLMERYEEVTEALKETTAVRNAAIRVANTVTTEMQKVRALNNKRFNRVESYAEKIRNKKMGG